MNGICIDGFVNTSPTTTLNEFILGCEMRRTVGRSKPDPPSVRRLSGFPAWAVSTTATPGAKQHRDWARRTEVNIYGADEL